MEVKSKENKIIIKALNMYGRVPEIYELLEEIDRLNNIVIEVRRYIEEDIKGNYFKRYDDEVYKLCDELLNILESKGGING